MGYHKVTEGQIFAVWQRIRNRQSNRSIAFETGLDKKTVNEYKRRIATTPIPDSASPEEVWAILSNVTRINGRPKPALCVLVPHENEIRELIAGNKEEKKLPMKAKTAWLVLNDKYCIGEKTSYETYKRFIRERKISQSGHGACARIETNPGEETQIDYGKMGVWDVHGRKQVVYAYIGILACSRFPFVHFCTSQDQIAFAESTVAMAEFYSGMTERLNLDNLKSGILKANIYDPTINRTFAELCAHYGIIADPARPGTPKDKGKVERIVPVVRELWKRLTAVHPEAILDDLTILAQAWCREEYGLSKHGTTGKKPYEVFLTEERACLKTLPSVRYEVASWDTAQVNTDQFVTVDKRRYGLPPALIGKQVDIRSTSKLVALYFEHKVVRSYVLSDKETYFLPDDFPAYAQPYTPGSMAAWYRDEAAKLTPQIHSYIELILMPGGNLANRKAGKCLSLIKQYLDMPGLSHVIGIAKTERIFIPDRLRVLLEDEKGQNILHFPQSEVGKAMTRKANYYTGSNTTD